MAALKAFAHSALWPKALIVILLALGLSMKWTAFVVVLVVSPFLIHVYRKGRSEQFHESAPAKRTRLLADEELARTVTLNPSIDRHQAFREPAAPPFDPDPDIVTWRDYW